MGDDETGLERKCSSDPVQCEGVKIPIMGCAGAYNMIRGGRLTVSCEVDVGTMVQVNQGHRGTSLRKQRGGCAPNIAYSLALLGERPTVSDIVGFALIFVAAACVLLQPATRNQR